MKVGALTHQVEVGSKESGIKEDLPGCVGRDTDALGRGRLNPAARESFVTG